MQQCFYLDRKKLDPIFTISIIDFRGATESHLVLNFYEEYSIDTSKQLRNILEFKTPGNAYTASKNNQKNNISCEAPNKKYELALGPADEYHIVFTVVTVTRVVSLQYQYRALSQTNPNHQQLGSTFCVVHFTKYLIFVLI